MCHPVIASSPCEGAPFNRRRVDFVCEVECDPVCAVSWFRNGVPVEFDDDSGGGGGSSNDTADYFGPHHYVVKSHAEGGTSGAEP